MSASDGSGWKVLAGLNARVNRMGLGAASTLLVAGILIPCIALTSLGVVGELTGGHGSILSLLTVVLMLAVAGYSSRAAGGRIMSIIRHRNRAN